MNRTVCVDSTRNRLLKTISSLFVSFAIAIQLFQIPVFALSAGGYESRIKNFKTEGYVSTGDKSTDLVNFAKNQVGKTGSELGYDANWCAAFVSDCAKYVGCDWNWTATPSAFKSVGTVIYTRGDEAPSVEPQAGDLALIDWSNNSNDCGHVEIVTGYIPVSECKEKEGNGKIGGLITVGGNTGSSGYAGNVVKVRKNPVNTNWGSSDNYYNCILYIVRPDYDKTPNATPTPTPVPAPSSTMPSYGQGTDDKTYIAPQISALRVVYSGYKYVEVEATIFDAGQCVDRYEIGTWDGGLISTFTPSGTTRVEGNKIKCSVPVDINEGFFADAKYLPHDLKIGIRSYDTSNNVHYALSGKISYQYRLPIPSAVNKTDDRTYYRFDQGYTWEDANEFAKSISNGHLVSIDSVNENSAVSSLVSAGSSYAYYTGGKYDLSGKWTWTDNSAFSYSNWITGQPNVSGGQRDALIITDDGWAAFSSKFKNLFGFIVEVENETSQLLTVYPTPSPTPKPTATPTPVPKLDTKQARSIVADAMALSYNGMKFYKAYRYDVNGDGVSDLILHSENKERFIIIGYSDSKKVRLYSDTLSNLATEVGFYKSKKSKKLFVRLTRAWAAGSGIWYESFSNGKLKNETGLEESFYDYDFDADKPVAKLRYTYQIGEKIVSKSKYNKKVKSWKLKKIKATKKTNILKRQTKMSSELIDDAAKYIKSDILGNKVDFIFRDINGDNIKDCYFVIPGKKAKGYKGIVVSNDNGDSNWTDVAVVLQSSKKGVVVKYLSPSDAKKLFKWAI